MAYGFVKMDSARMENISRIRKARGLSQSELADAVDVKQATISRIEKGVNKPSMEVLEKIADVLGITVVEIIGLPAFEALVLEKFRAASPQRRAALFALLDSE